MRKAILLGSLLSAACTVQPRNAGAVDVGDIPVRGEDPGYPCRKPGDRDFIGQVATQELGARMLAEARARTLRWVPHGAMITMDYSPNRLTVRLDEQNRIIAMSCG